MKPVRDYLKIEKTYENKTPGGLYIPTETNRGQFTGLLVMAGPDVPRDFLKHLGHTVTFVNPIGPFKEKDKLNGNDVQYVYVRLENLLAYEP